MNISKARSSTSFRLISTTCTEKWVQREHSGARRWHLWPGGSSINELLQLTVLLPDNSLIESILWKDRIIGTPLAGVTTSVHLTPLDYLCAYFTVEGFISILELPKKAAFKIGNHAD
jgi:hypothetical protein